MNNDSDIEDNETEMALWNNDEKENFEFEYASEKHSSNNTSPNSIIDFTTFMSNAPLTDFEKQMDIDHMFYAQSPMDMYSVLSTSPVNNPSSFQRSLFDSMCVNASPDYMGARMDSINENLVLIMQIILKCLFVIKILKYTFQVNF